MVNDSTAGLKFILDLKFLDNIIDGYEAATFIGRTKIDKTTSPTWILWFGMNVEANRFDTSAIFKFIKLLNYQILKLFVSDLPHTLILSINGTSPRSNRQVINGSQVMNGGKRWLYTSYIEGSFWQRQCCEEIVRRLGEWMIYGDKLSAFLCAYSVQLNILHITIGSISYNLLIINNNLAHPTGFEPVTSAFGGQCHLLLLLLLLLLFLVSCHFTKWLVIAVIS